MSNVRTFVPKEVGITRREAELKQSALMVLRDCIDRVENHGCCAVAVVLSDVEGSTEECFSALPHRRAMIGGLEVLKQRIIQASIMTDNEEPILPEGA